MSCDDKNQSAIAEAADQLFLDTADAGRLDIVTGNLGLHREGVTFDDDEWRAVGKLVALQPKQVIERFYRMVELCLGPQYARIGTLADEVNFDDRQLQMADPSPFIQLGTLIIDPTMPTEETVEYCRRDLATGIFYLKKPLKYHHTPITLGATYTTQDRAAGNNAVNVIDGSVFPPTPFPAIYGRGTPEEEIIQVSNVAGNVITFTTNTVSDHLGPTTLFYARPLVAAAPQGRTFLKFAVGDTRGFPASGWVRINAGGGSDETVQFESNDVVNDVLFLKTPLANAHVAAEYVALVRPGALLEVCPVVESGVHWSVWETSPREVQVIIPKDLRILGPFDATWLHDSGGQTHVNHLTDNVGPTERTIRLDGVIALSHDAQMVLINGLGPYFYTLLVNKTETLAAVSSPTIVGATQMNYTLDQTSTRGFPVPQTEPYWVIIDEGGGNQETVQVRGTSSSRLIFSTPLTNPHSAAETIQPLNQIILDRATGQSFTAGQNVEAFQTTYGSFPNLVEGNPRDAFGVIQPDQWAGGYIYDPTQRGVSAISTALSVAVPPVIAVASSQVPGRTSLEVDDASLWPAPPFTPFEVRLGENTGFQEDRTLLNRVLKNDAAATTPITIVGATTMAYTLTSVGEFPVSDGANPAGYRVIIDQGGAHEEIATVAQNDTGTHTFTLTAGLTQPHAAGESIALLHDVLTFDILTRPHSGPRILPSRVGAPVHAFTKELTVSPAPAGFPPAGGFIWLNFGKEIINGRKRIVTVSSPTSYVLQSTIGFPNSGFPYPVTLSPGQATEEIVEVTAVNTGTSTLTFAAPGALNSHAVGEYVERTSGDPESLEYNSILTGPDRLVFTVPQLIASRHLVGERVMYSPAISQSHTDGSSYGFKLPPDPSGCLKALFDFVRAAGIKATILLK